MPDAVFVEDAAVVFDELAIMTRPGADSRRAETDAVAEAVAALSSAAFIDPPATIDGGDVLAVARDVFVGRLQPHECGGRRQMRAILEPLRLHASARCR